MKRIANMGRVLFLLLVAGLSVPTAVLAGSEDFKLEVKLVWGSNEPPPKAIREVDPESSRKLKSVFKWERYYEMSATNLVSAVGTPRRLKLNAETEVAVHNLGKSHLEVELINKGKPVVRKKQKVSPGELLVLAGDDVNNTAWFVMFRREPESRP